MTVMRWAVGASLLAAAALSGVSTAVALDARSQVHDLEGTAAATGHQVPLAQQVRDLRRRLDAAERPVNGDDPNSATVGNFTGLQQDVHDLGSIIQTYGGGQGEPQIRKTLNELLAICRGAVVLYRQNGLQPPACPNDL